MGDIFRRNSFAYINNGKSAKILQTFYLDCNNFRLGGVFDCIVHQVNQHLINLIFISDNLYRVVPLTVGLA
jgi:hypothetical protein